MKKLSGSTKKLSAAQRFDRLREIESRREDLMSQANHLKARIEQSAGRKETLERELLWDQGIRPARAYSTRPATKSEIEALKTEIAGLEQLLQDLKAEKAPIQAELDDLNAEYEELQNNHQKVSLTDLKGAGSEISKIESEINRVENARDDALAKIPSEQLQKLKSEMEEAASEHDLLAADVDLGEAPESDLKKASSRLTSLKKQLAEFEENARLAESAGRGYARRLARLQTAKAAAEKELSCLLTLYARQMHESEVERLNSALEQVEQALTTLQAATVLSERYGDGTPLSTGLYRSRIDIPNLPGLTKERVEAHSEAAEKQIEDILRQAGSA